MDLAEIKQCRQITEAHIAEAIETREDTRALLEHAASISAPRQGGARILLVFAKIAREGSDWVDGALRVELRAAADGSVVDVYAEIGAGLRERVLPSFTMRLPLAELLAAIKRVPDALSPLSLAEPVSGGVEHVVLRAGEVRKPAEAEGAAPASERGRDEPIARMPSPNPLSLGDLPTISGGQGARRPIPKRPDAARPTAATPPARPPPPRVPTPMWSRVEAEAPPAPQALSLSRSEDAAQDPRAADADLPAPAMPFARIKLRRSAGLPRIVTEAAPSLVADRRAEPEPQQAPPREADEGVDEGWE